MKTIKKIFTYRIMVLFMAVAVSGFVLESCAPKANCGTRSQHKARAKKTKRMAGSMMHG
jgi:hypothetical protein